MNKFALAFLSAFTLAAAPLQAVIFVGSLPIVRGDFATTGTFGTGGANVDFAPAGVTFDVESGAATLSQLEIDLSSPFSLEQSGIFTNPNTFQQVEIGLRIEVMGISGVASAPPAMLNPLPGGNLGLEPVSITFQSLSITGTWELSSAGLPSLTGSFLVDRVTNNPAGVPLPSGNLGEELNVTEFPNAITWINQRSLEILPPVPPIPIFEQRAPIIDETYAGVPIEVDLFTVRATFPDRSQGGTRLAMIPEPGILSLLSLAGLAFWRRRR